MHPFEIVDVFTARALAGNQLAVVTDARGLDPAAMQAIAREFNFAESTFVLPPDDPANTARVRIFTPTGEMPFAGHPNVGTAFVLARQGMLFGRPLGTRLLFEEQAGLVVIDVVRRDGVVTGARVRAPRPLELAESVPPADVAALAMLDEQDILSGRFAPRLASVGAEFLFAEVSTDALARARPDPAAFAAARGRIGLASSLIGLHLHSRSASRPGVIEARMFAPLDGVPEDAATGSAAAALGALLNHLDPTETRFTVQQGRFIGRPSVIEVEAAPGEVWIGGDCAAFASGMLAG